MDLTGGVAGRGLVTRLVLVTELSVENGLAVRPVGGDAVLQAGGFEIPTGRGPFGRIVGSLPGRAAIGQAVPSAVEVAPRAPLHTLVVLGHVQVDIAPIPQRPYDLGAALGKCLV